MAKHKFSPKSVRERRAALRKKALRVLVVENHSDTREGIKLFLKALGYHAVAATSAEEALAMAEKEDFDLLLSDITLPDGDGWEMLSTLRERGRAPRHAIAMSGLSRPADQARSREAGYQAHLVKPFQPPELEKALHQVADDLAPLVVASAPIPARQERLRQKLHDGLCQQLAAAALLQAALVNRLDAVGKSSKARPDSRAEERLRNGAAPELPSLVEEARRIGQLIRDAMEEVRVVMQEIGTPPPR